MIIGANTVVTTDIPPRSVAGAFRAEVLATVQDDGSFEKLQPSVALSRRELAERLRAIEDQLRGLRDLQR